MKICEIYKGIIGEGGLAGYPAVIVRTSGCNLRCKWCDTKYAYHEGEEMKLEDILEEIKKLQANFVLLTGGEPLIQPDVCAFSNLVVTEGFGLIVETNGSMDISILPEDCIRIVDIKPPGSGMSEHILWDNINHLRAYDEVKFVIADKADYLWARKKAMEYKLFERVSSIFLSPAYSILKGQQLAEWLIDDVLPFRLNIQLHKILWGEKRGV